MKTTKKLLALVMALALCLSLGVCAFADGEDTEVEEEVTSSVTTDANAPIVKVVTGDNAPSETYTFTVTGTSYTNTPSSVTTQPTIPDVTITTSTTEGAKSSALDLTNITEIGTYTYVIAEVTPTTKTAGITYDTTTYTLKVTAYYDADGTTLKKDIAITNASGEKVTAATFTNIYTANSLTVTKDVTGNLGDTTKEFSFTVTFANNNEAISWVNAITYNSDTTGAASVVVNGNTVTFTLSDSDSITFSNIPSGITYTVTEDSYTADGYTTKIGENTTSTTTGTMAGEDVSVTVVNDKDQEVDTGITLDSLPYVLVLVAV
ncbi:MAG: DUF5979 domain-containing protein, partial [Oscillospiraceae bacterium]|nr:DUF5979 domain-containing protein [Oscillospiraceae bacterium]